MHSCIPEKPSGYSANSSRDDYHTLLSQSTSQSPLFGGWTLVINEGGGPQPRIPPPVREFPPSAAVSPSYPLTAMSPEGISIDCVFGNSAALEMWVPSCLGIRWDLGNLLYLSSPFHDPECAEQQPAALRVEASREAGHRQVFILSFPYLNPLSGSPPPSQASYPFSLFLIHPSLHPSSISHPDSYPAIHLHSFITFLIHLMTSYLILL